MSKADNKQLEEAIKTMQHWIEYEKENKEKIYKADELIKIQETVLKEIKRIQEENKTMETEIAEHVYWESTPSAEIKNLYISKDKIREKIEELEKEYKEALEENSTKAFILKCQIEILKELIAK